MTRITLIFSLLFVTLVQCARGTAVNNPVPDYSNQVPETVQTLQSEKINYILSDSTIVLFTPVCECEDSLLKKGARPDHYEITLTENRLTIETKEITVNTQNQKVKVGTIYSRISGKGIQGTWKKEGLDFKSTHALTGSDSTILIDSITKEMISLGEWLYIEGSSLHIYYGKEKITREPFTKIFMMSRAPKLTPGFNITVDTMGTDSVRLIGLTSGDTVLIVEKQSGDIHYTSSNLGFTAHTWYVNTTKCPNDLYPSWLIENFIVANKL